MLVRPLLRDLIRPLSRGLFRNVVGGGGAVKPVLLLLTVTDVGDGTATYHGRSSEDGFIWFYRSTNPSETKATILTNGTDVVCLASVTADYVDALLTNDVTYYLHAVAEDPEGNTSSAAHTAGFVPEAVITPTGLAELLIQFEDGTGGTLPHRIYSLPVGDEAQPIDLAIADTEHTLTGLDWNTEHTVDIYSFDDPDESIALSVDIWTAPEDAPSGLSATATGENSIELTWTEPASPPASLNAGTGYEIWISLASPISWVLETTVPVGDVSAEITGLDGDTEYTFKMRSVNGNPAPHDPGYSPYSSAVNETTDADETGPTLSAVSATAGDTTADLTMTSSETGNIWWSVTTNATETAAAIKAGTGAVDYDTAACTAATPLTPTATGLTNGVTYYLHVVAEDPVPNQSTVTNTAGFVPAVVGYTASSVVFDGTNDYLDRASDFSGISDGDKGLFSAWVKMGSGSSDTGFYEILTLGNFEFRISRRNSGQILISGINSSATGVLNINSNNNSCIKSSGWVHILASWDLSTAGRRHIYINGSAQTTQVVFTVGGTLDYTRGGVEIGSASGGQQKWDGLMAEVYFATEWLDISVEANREKFSLAGAPVDLGANGSTPTGTQPILYLANPYTSFETNLGSGGNFTVVGALADGGADHP